MNLKKNLEVNESQPCEYVPHQYKCEQNTQLQLLRMVLLKFLLFWCKTKYEKHSNDLKHNVVILQQEIEITTVLRIKHFSRQHTL